VASEGSQRIGDDVHAKNDEELDAGTVTGVGTPDSLTVSVRDQIKREQAKTTNYLAYALIATLILSFIYWPLCRDSRVASFREERGCKSIE
jgi:hypothetical protein